MKKCHVGVEFIENRELHVVLRKKCDDRQKLSLQDCSSPKSTVWILKFFREIIKDQ